MAEEEKKQDKPAKRVEVPPRISDPKLSQKVDFADKPRKKTIINIKRGDLDDKRNG